MSRLKRRIGLFSASFIGISSIIGSGWLFAAYRTANIAGPGAIFAWVIAAFIILLLALAFSEIASLYPRRGLSAVVATLSHNKYFGFPFAIANWLGIVAVIALEADATVEYFINIFPNFKPYLFFHDELTILGNLISVCLILLFSLINYWGVNVLAKTNNVLAILKVFIPLITAIIILSVSFHPHNFVAINNSIIPYGAQSIISAIITTGIIISFNGFQSIISFANEVKRPHRTIPLSLIISITFCLILYLLLQISYIGAMPKEIIAFGWNAIVFNAPMIQLCSAIGLGFLTTIIYAGAFIAPTGTAINFVGASTRMFAAMAKTEQMPKFFAKADEKTGMPRRSLYMNTIIAIIFLFAFNSWDNLAIILSLLHVISYVPVPLAILVFRYTLKGKTKYKFKLKWGVAISLFLFIVFNFLIIYSNHIIFAEMLIMLAIFQIIFILTSSRSFKDLITALKASYPIFLYLTVFWIITYLGPNSLGILHGISLILVCTIISLIFFVYLVYLGRTDTSFADSVLLDALVDGH